MINVAVICGGISSEHEISCVSAGGVLKGLDSSKSVSYTHLTLPTKA